MFSIYNTLRGIASTNFGWKFQKIKNYPTDRLTTVRFQPVVADEIAVESRIHDRIPRAASAFRLSQASEIREFAVYLHTLTRKPQR